MDMKEASAMTEASGLVDDRDAIGSPQPSGQTESAETRRWLRQPSNEAALRWAERLRKVTVQAVNRHRSMPPPMSCESETYRADRRRAPTPIHSLTRDGVDKLDHVPDSRGGLGQFADALVGFLRLANCLVGDPCGLLYLSADFLNR